VGREWKVAMQGIRSWTAARPPAHPVGATMLMWVWTRSAAMAVRACRITPTRAGEIAKPNPGARLTWSRLTGTPSTIPGPGVGVRIST
jgi:hypothetical protein